MLVVVASRPQRGEKLEMRGSAQDLSTKVDIAFGSITGTQNTAFRYVTLV
jgi:hypothetical protein